MWNLFRKTPRAEPFPKPAWPPIQQLDRIDLAAPRADGGLDLFLVASQPLDGSTETLANLREKFGTYLATLDSEEFQTDMKHPPRDRTTIILVCEHPIHPAAHAVIEECRLEAAIHGLRFQLRTTHG